MPLKIDHPERKFHLPTIHFHGRTCWKCISRGVAPLTATTRMIRGFGTKPPFCHDCILAKGPHTALPGPLHWHLHDHRGALQDGPNQHPEVPCQVCRSFKNTLGFVLEMLSAQYLCQISDFPVVHVEKSCLIFFQRETLDMYLYI